MEDTNNIEARNIQSILNGDQLSMIQQLQQDFNQHKISFEEFRAQVKIGYGYMLTLPKLEETMKAKVEQINSETNERKQQMSFENLLPHLWKQDDPKIHIKVNQFTDILSTSLDECRESYKK